MMTALRCLVRWLLSLVWLALAHVAVICLGFGNFVIAWGSFDAQGYEPTPLAEIPFLGPFALALGVGEATVASLYALVLTVAMNALIIGCAKLLARLIQTLLDWRPALRSSDPEVRDHAVGYVARLVETAVWLVPVLACAVLVARWDVGQLTLGTEARLANLVNPEELIDWAPDRARRLGEFLADFVAVTAWGYAGCVAGIALVMEHAWVRAGERWGALEGAVEQAINGASPVAASRISPVGSSATAGATAGLQGTTGVGAARVGAGAAAAISGGSGLAETPTSSLGPEPVPPPAPGEVPLPSPPAAASQDVDVVVGPGEMRRVPLGEVEARPEQYVRDTSGRQWFLRHYYESVMGTTGRSSEANEANEERR